MDTSRRRCVCWRVVERRPLTKMYSPQRQKMRAEVLHVWMHCVYVCTLHGITLSVWCHDGEGRAWPLCVPTSITASFPPPAWELSCDLSPDPFLHHMKGQQEHDCPPDSKVSNNISPWSYHLEISSMHSLPWVSNVGCAACRKQRPYMLWWSSCESKDYISRVLGQLHSNAA